jgi:hypothetical protein
MTEAYQVVGHDPGSIHSVVSRYGAIRPVLERIVRVASRFQMLKNFGHATTITKSCPREDYLYCWLLASKSEKRVCRLARHKSREPFAQTLIRRGQIGRG